LYSGDYGPSSSALAAAGDSPISLFFYFMPKKLWSTISAESNRYHSQQIGVRTDRIRKRQKKQRVKDPETKHQIRSRLRKEAVFQPHEFVNLVGLLVARMLCPHKQKLARHWSPVAEGAVPAGSFGRFMPKNRFNELMKSIHFTNNLDPQAQTDRAWKVRSVVDCLQATFRRGYTVPPVLSFDEAIIPNRSRYNPTRQYLKDKPHKWGTKLFVSCCARSAYCVRYVFFYVKSTCWIFQHELHN
jgi:Transposase IS4